MVAQAIGRWGNYFNQELSGDPEMALAEVREATARLVGAAGPPRCRGRWGPASG
jgi:prolipoprotein diacylglyceryltransferase